MASKIIEEGSCYEWSSYMYVRGYHDCQAVWTPTIGEMLLLKVELTNSYDDLCCVSYTGWHSGWSCFKVCQQRRLLLSQEGWEYWICDKIN